jgi:hypothetical protein
MRVFHSGRIVSSVAGLVALLLSLAATAQEIRRGPDIMLRTDAPRNPRFCQGDAEVYSQVNRVNLHFRNVGKIPHVVSLRPDTPINVLVAKSEIDLQNGLFEVEWYPTTYPSARPIDGTEANSHKEPVIIAPGGTFDTSLPIALIVNTTSRDLPGTIRAGRHFLQLKLTVQISALRRNRSQASRPESLTLLSNPVQVEIASPPALEDCGLSPPN